MMNYNSIIKNIVPSASMQAGLSYNASDYTNFAIGAPDIPPPQEITDIIQSRAAMSKHPYTSTEGSLKARTNIAEILSDDTIEIPLEHVMMCEGAKFGIYISLKTVCNRKSKVLIIEPYWLSYPNIIAELELETIVFTPLFAEKGRLIYEVDQIISAAVNNKVSAVIINNPNNPSGQIIHNESVQKIADDLLKHNIWLIIDEVYKDLTFDESIHGSFNITGENVLRVGSFSKSLCIPGIRLGYIVAEPKILKNINLLTQHIQTCVNTYSLAIAENISKSTFINHSRMCAGIYSKRYEALKHCIKNSKIKLLHSESSFYAFADFRTYFSNAADACKFLAEKHHLLSTPGFEYGISFKSFVRFCLTLPEEKITNKINSILYEGF